MQKITTTARSLIKMATHAVGHWFRSYVLTPETLAPAAVTVVVLAGGLVVGASGPNAPLVRLLGMVAVTITSTGLGLIIASVQLRVMAHRVEMAEMITEIRTDYIDQAQATIRELKLRISRLYSARIVRVNNTGPTRVFGNYRRVERALP